MILGGAIGLEWSDTNIDATPSGGKFLGQFANDSVTLTLIGLPAHLSVSVSFDLYLIESTEENGEHFFELSIDGGPVLMTTSFSHNPDSTQSYPDNYPGGDYPGQTGAAVGTLGYSDGDMVYSFPNLDRSFTFTHTNSTLVVRFSGSGSAGQSWGLDNVCITLGLPGVLNVIDIDPNTLNLKSNGEWVTCHLRLPEGSNAADIKLETVMLENVIAADWLVFNENNQIAMIKFSGSAVRDYLIEQELSGDVELTVTGELIDGTTFAVSDTITVIDKGGKKK